MKIKQAVVLAAGQGKRLQPLTFEMPKAMVLVNGKPMVQIILEQLKSVGVETVVLVVNYHKEKITDYFGDGSKLGLKLIYAVQKEMKGTANAILCAEPYIKDDKFFLIYCDSLFETEVLNRMLKHDSDGVMAAKHVDDPSRYGVFVVKGKRIIKFVEKPDEPISNLANLSIKIMPKEIFEECKHVPLSKRGEYEFSDALQALIDKGFNIEYEPVEHCMDIGTHEQLKEAQELAKKFSL